MGVMGTAIPPAPYSRQTRLASEVIGNQGYQNGCPYRLSSIGCPIGCTRDTSTDCTEIHRFGGDSLQQNLWKSVSSVDQPIGFVRGSDVSGAVRINAKESVNKARTSGGIRCLFGEHEIRNLVQPQEL